MTASGAARLCAKQNFVRSAALGCIKVPSGASKSEIQGKLLSPWRIPTHLACREACWCNKGPDRGARTESRPGEGSDRAGRCSPKTWLRGPGPPAALEGAWYQAASFRGGRGKLRARDGHRGESAASFTWLHDRHGVNIFVSASYVGTGCRRAGPPPKAGPAQAAVDSATEAPESGWCLAYSSSLGRRVIRRDHSRIVHTFV